MDENIVYHYTSHAAAMNIIRESKLWLTNIRFQNDRREWWWVYDQVRASMEAARKSGSPIDAIIENDILTAMSRKGGISICTSSFSYKKDDAAQWDRYASKGRGIAIGFKTESLKEAISGSHSIFGKVEYSQELLQRKVDEALKYLADELMETGSCSLRSMNDPIAKFAALFKNHTFDSEMEFRIGMLGVANTQYKFFPRENTIVPYLPLSIPTDSVVDICIGPLADEESNDAWSLFLSQLDGESTLNDIKIRNSISSLR